MTLKTELTTTEALLYIARGTLRRRDPKGGEVGVRFHRLVGGDSNATTFSSLADRRLLRKSTTTRMVFMSHKTGDQDAERLADHILSSMAYTYTWLSGMITSLILVLTSFRAVSWRRSRRVTASWST